jgi:hypothetical protein
MKTHRQKRIDTVATLLCIVFISACQPTPVPPLIVPEQAPPSEQPQAKSPEHAIEIAKASKTIPEIPPAPAKPSVSRVLPESIVGAPEKELASRRLAYNTMINSRSADAANAASWHYRRTHAGQIVGFEFSNHGGNPILPPRRDAAKNQFFSRDFQFRFDERARQDIYLLVTDWAPSRDRHFRLSELMNSLLHFFPRSFLPAIVSFDGRNIITLPTGEEVEFNTQTHEILAGVLSESAVDLNPDRNARKYPAIIYNGKGIVVRANSRGADPRIGTTATITNGSPLPTCDKGVACHQCQVSARELWDQAGAVRFKFATDEEFDRFLLARCQFGLPKTDNGYALPPPDK